MQHDVSAGKRSQNEWFHRLKEENDCLLEELNAQIIEKKV